MIHLQHVWTLSLAHAKNTAPLHTIKLYSISASRTFQKKDSKTEPMCAFICTQRVFLGPKIRCRMKVIKEGGGAVQSIEREKGAGEGGGPARAPGWGPKRRSGPQLPTAGGGKGGGGAVRKEIKCNTMSAVRDAKPNGLTMGAVPGIYAF